MDNLGFKCSIYLGYLVLGGTLILGYHAVVITYITGRFLRCRLHGTNRLQAAREAIKLTPKVVMPNKCHMITWKEYNTALVIKRMPVTCCNADIYMNYKMDQYASFIHAYCNATIFCA